MTLYVGGRAVSAPAALSQPARLVLSCVDGGTEWLNHAILAGVRYAFEDELALVVAAQHGLHGAAPVLLPRLGLMVGAARLIAMSPADLQTLRAVEAGQREADAAPVRKLLATQQLLTAGDLANADALLKTLGVASAPLFQVLTLRERIALHDLKAELGEDGAPAAAAQKAAARFAVEWAYGPAEFTDYFRAYLALTTGKGALSDAKAREALQALAPMLFDLLDCPAVSGLVAPQEAAQAVANWLDMGRHIGFPRLSRGVWQLVVHGGYRGETGAAARSLIDAHVEQAHALIRRSALVSGRLTQDGGSITYPLHAPSDSGEIVLQLDIGGAITLQRFVPASA